MLFSKDIMDRPKLKCYYCSSKFLSKVTTVGKFSIYKCINCKLLITNLGKRFNSKVANKSIYDSTYLSNYLFRADLMIDRFKKRLVDIEKFKSGGKILDIGCGPGLFLKAVEGNSKYQWDLYGIDINERSVKIARQTSKAKILYSELKPQLFPENYFDCITLFDVLEHDKNLVSDLSVIRKILKKDGLLVIQSPNNFSLMAYITGKEWDWWSVPDHVIHFTPKTLCNILKDNDFSIRKIFTWEPANEFVLNIKGVIRRRLTPFLLLNKIVAKLSSALLYILWFVLSILEKKFNIGALIVVFAMNSK